jgi:hypothetical protein
MIFDTLISAFSPRITIDKNESSKASRKKYITDKYNERSITNRYFK